MQRWNKQHLGLNVTTYLPFVLLFLVILLLLYRTWISKLPSPSSNGFSVVDKLVYSNGDRSELVGHQHGHEKFTEDTNKERNEKPTENSSKYFTPKKETLEDSDWKNGSFCHKFLANTFQTPISVCANEKRRAVHCYGTSFSNEMGTCILENVLVNPGHLAIAMENPDSPAFNQQMASIALLSDKGLSCNDTSTTQLEKHIGKNDYIMKVIDHIKHVNTLTARSCDQWIEEDVFFFTANKVHIYFRFLDYFNMHKMLADFHSNRPQVIRISGSHGYNFADFDTKLLSDTKFRTLKDFGNGSLCFKKVVLVPRSYASFLFRCKMNLVLKARCYNCKGKGLSKTQVLTFRDRVLRACSLEDRGQSSSNFSVIFVSRRPYTRFKDDNAKRFSRVMDNEDSLMKHLRDTLKCCTIQKVNLENLDICEQVRLAHNADIYLGVHGAGLVHLWWLRDHAVMYELEPSYETGNPTFWMLAHLSQRKYMKSRIAGGSSRVHANVESISSKIQEVVTKWKGFDIHRQNP